MVHLDLHGPFLSYDENKFLTNEATKIATFEAIKD